jgi:hypothetical protein
LDGPSASEEDDVINELRQSGAPEDVIAAYQGQARQDRFEVHPDNWEAVEWFLQVSDCWRWNNSVCQGLDWGLVESESRLSGVTRSPAVFSQLKVVAQEARRLINKRLRHE